MLREEEFGFDQLAQDYWGHTPSSVEAAAIIQRLFSAPMYFYKKGKGRYKAAPADALKAALAGVERKKREQEQVSLWADELAEGRLPEAIAVRLMELLFKPDKNSLEFKAFEYQACHKCGLPPLRLAARVGGISSVPDYLLAGFLLEYFPKGTGFHYQQPVTPVDEAALPQADVAAFSIDDAATTEIDDALSLTPLPNGNQRVGVHIAAPTLGMPIGPIWSALSIRACPRCISPATRSPCCRMKWSGIYPAGRPVLPGGQPVCRSDPRF